MLQSQQKKTKIKSQIFDGAKKTNPPSPRLLRNKCHHLETTSFDLDKSYGGQILNKTRKNCP